MTSIVEVADLVKVYGKHLRPAVAGVSFSVPEGGTFGIVGESGSGKTTVARMLLGLVEPTSGRISIAGIDAVNPSRAARKELHRTIQVVFQDPYSSMNPKLKIGRILAEGVRRVHPHRDTAAEVERLLDLVGLPTKSAGVFPHELSGGQRQRVAIARALAVNPRVLVADEPVSALDVSMRGQVLNLLSTLQRDLQLTCVFISHDLAIVRQFCDEVVVMQGGEIVERGDPTRVMESPEHPYTRRLLDSVLELPGR